MDTNVRYDFKIIVVGYSTKLRGGVTQVTSVLLKNISNMELHPSIYCYHPKYKALFLYVMSVFCFAFKVMKKRKGVITHIIIGSTGDAIRAIPYMAIIKSNRIKTCIQYHKSADVIFSKINSKILKFLVCKALSQADIHCFLSKLLEQSFKEMVPIKIESKVIPNALEEKWIEVPVLSRKERHRDIVFFGRWSWEKGIDDLLSCMAMIKFSVNCEIYSDAVPGNVYKNCKTFPWVNEAEVMSIMRTAKLVVLPSYAEAYPTVLLEAAACGTPFIASNIAGIPDIAEESGGGRVFAPGDILTLAELIEELMADQAQWQRMSESGKKWVQTLSVQRVKEKWHKVYKKIY